MNTSAERHLAKAAGYVARGEEFYRKAAEEIAAAKEADPTLSNSEIGERIGWSKTQVREIVVWATSDLRVDQPTPFSGKSHADNRATAHAKRILRTAPLEQVEQIISELPPERRQGVAAAAGNAYHKARQDFAEEERHLSPSKRKEREAAQATMGGLAGRVTAGIDVLAIVNHLEQATDKLSEMVANRTLTADNGKAIAEAHERFCQELEVAVMMVGLEFDLRRSS